MPILVHEIDTGEWQWRIECGLPVDIMGLQSLADIFRNWHNVIPIVEYRVTQTQATPTIKFRRMWQLADSRKWIEDLELIDGRFVHKFNTDAFTAAEFLPWQTDVRRMVDPLLIAYQVTLFKLTW